MREHRLAFHRHHRLARQRDLAPDHHRRAFGLGVEAALVVEREEDVVAPVLVHAGGRLRLRRMRIDQHRQLVELDFDLLGQVLGFGARRRHAHRDGFADEAHLVVRQRMALGQLVARHRGGRGDRRHLVQVGPDEDVGLGARRLDDASDAAMRDRTAQERHLALARQDHVRHEAAAPVQMSRVFFTLDPRSHPLRHCCSRLQRRCTTRAAISVRPLPLKGGGLGWGSSAGRSEDIKITRQRSYRGCADIAKR